MVHSTDFIPLKPLKIFLMVKNILKLLFSGLTGSNKLEAVEKFGAEQVQIWRRSYATPPPVMESNHEYYETIQKVTF